MFTICSDYVHFDKFAAKAYYHLVWPQRYNRLNSEDPCPSVDRLLVIIKTTILFYMPIKRFEINRCAKLHKAIVCWSFNSQIIVSKFDSLLATRSLIYIHFKDINYINHSPVGPDGLRLHCLLGRNLRRTSRNGF